MAGSARGAEEAADAREAPSADLQAFYDQEIDWSSCEGDHECATLTVPMDYADPEGDTIDLAPLRGTAADRGAGSLVVNPGGPGAPGTTTPPRPDRCSAYAAAAFDVAGFDPRGTGESSLGRLPE